ncbi:MAG: hypothetical protein EBR30_14755 [Cytophagia bacterium]|jgi:hypothetical protein|nr:hypothetical protein [Cytophagia bacterium]
MKKVKTEYLGQYVTMYNNLGFDTSFIVTEETANDADFYTSRGLGYLFEETEPKSKKYKGVEDANTEG